MKKKDSLVIVESPTKAKTLARILGDKFSVVPSMGHLIDLPKTKLGVDVEKDFTPSYVVISGRQKVVSALKKEAKEKSHIYVATDPDREGEAIGWFIKDRFLKNKKVQRVVFHEITPSAIKEAFAHPHDFDLQMIEAQAGRRILDRIVGYFLSPLLWKKIARGLSAGRVQSVALRLVIERERQINNFLPQEYWEIEAELKKKTESRYFIAKLSKIEEKKAEIKNKEEADSLLADIKEKTFQVLDIKKAEKKRYPAAPFITSTLQQEAFNKLRFNANRTMIIAQQLYEGIDIGESTPVGLITYMRTDSTHVATEAIQAARKYILKKFGKEYLPKIPNVYKVKKHAQEAHEAIRPTLLSRQPQDLKGFLSPEQYKLYELIYCRFVASQMVPARYLVTTVDIQAEKYLFTASGTDLVFDGFTVVYNKDAEEEDEDKAKNIIPALEKGETLDLLKLIPSQHFTKPPPRFSDSSLVKILEEEGIGRPSTYAPIVSTLIYRDYIRRIKGYFHPTELGFKVCDLLVEYFPKVMDVKFTAFLEEELDEIEEGKVNKIKVLQDFYGPFRVSLDFAQANIKKEVITTDEICDKCGKPMVIKWGRRGKFLSCSDYPTCKNSKSITTGVACPQEGCGGELIERRSRRGVFYGCTNYPKCTFTSRTLPQA
ncbi:MAG: type I DNA topoisomerase [Candidatus Omnitrophica bacterium]|nr:type I DNA topoisomerase [Candidatus Omnitrophota bacterium]MDD5592429.1 type I DNA topoisomerase [Candidatus Omnitrophota bacterium]